MRLIVGRRRYTVIWRPKRPPFRCLEGVRVSVRLGVALAGVGAVLLLVGRVAGLPLATHSIAFTMLVLAGLVLIYALAVAPRRSMIRSADRSDSRQTS